MRTETITRNIYTFDELSDKAKENARDWWRNAASYDEWWECIYDDAERVDFKINSFDIYRRKIEGEFISCPVLCAEKILKEHGGGGIRLEANAFLKLRHEFMENAKKDEYGELATYELENELERMEREFRISIQQEYLILLRNEHEYWYGEEHVDDCIIANEYEFTEYGEII